MKDFNERFAKDHLQPVSSYALHTAFNISADALDNTFNNTGYRPASVLRPSSIGLPALELCARRFFGGCNEESLSLKTKCIFYQGNVFEALGIYVLSALGYEVSSFQQQIEWRGLTGSIDCIADDYVVDFKTMNDSKFKRIKKQGYMDIPEYLSQLAIYSAASGKEAVFLCYNKNTSEMMVMGVEEKVMLGHLQRAEYIVESWAKINKWEDCFNYFSHPVTTDGKVPPEMKWSKHVDRLYHVRSVGAYTTFLESPYYKFP